MDRYEFYVSMAAIICATIAYCITILIEHLAGA